MAPFAAIKVPCSLPNDNLYHAPLRYSTQPPFGHFWSPLLGPISWSTHTRQPPPHSARRACRRTQPCTNAIHSQLAPTRRTCRDRTSRAKNRDQFVISRPRDHESPHTAAEGRRARGGAARAQKRRITQRTISINPNRSPHTFVMALDNTQRPMASPGPGHAARLDTCVRACESSYSQPQLPAQPNPAQPSAPRPTAARRAATEGVRRE